MKSVDVFHHDSNISDFFSGTTVLLKGVKYSFKNKKILGLVLLPLIASLILMYFTFGWFFENINTTLQMWMWSKDQFLFFGGEYLYKILNFFVGLISGLVAILAYYVLLQLLYIPFCSYLSEVLLRDKGIVEVKGLKEFILFNISMFKVGLLKTVLVSALSVFLFLTSFFPLLGLVPLYFGFLILSYDSFDYGLELYGFSLKERKGFFSDSFFLINGHALILFVINIIPGLILLTVPFSVVGASLKLGEMYELKRRLA